jgi:hypothetical protein
LSGLVELGVADHEQRIVAVEVVIVECKGFAESHPGDGKQAQQSSVGGSLQWVADILSRLEQGRNIFTRVDIGLVSNPAVRDQVDWWNLVPGVGSVQMARETPDSAKAVSLRDGQSVFRLVGPCLSYCCGHERGSLLVCVFDEPAEHLAFSD